MYKETKFLKLNDIVTINNFKFEYDQTNINLQKTFHSFYTYTQENTNTIQEEEIPWYKTPVKRTTSGSNSVTPAMWDKRDWWKNLQNKLNPELTLSDLNGPKFLKTNSKIMANRVDSLNKSYTLF